MRYPFILLAVVLVACTVPPDAPKTETAVADSKPDPRPAPKPVTPKVPAIMEVPATKEQCANIKTGDVKDDIHLKLDCLLSPQK